MTTPVTLPKKLRLIFFELVLILAGHFLYTASIKTTDMAIRGDGKGYYDYLPATFIYHDLNFGFREQAMPYAQDNTSHNIVCNGKIINKYTCGLAVLWSPFFVLSHEWAKSSTEIPHNGYSLPYHFAIYLASLVYALIGLIYLRKLLLLFTGNPWLVRGVQIIMLLATNLYGYVYFEPSMSHAYSFTLITLFLYVFMQWNKTGLNKYLYIASMLLGLIVLVRPFNLLVLLFIPFMAGGIHPLINRLKQTSLPAMGMAVFLFIGLASIQPLIWYLQCGRFFPWTYTQETFLFTQPAGWQTLFGFKKGLFVYTPVLLIGVFAPFVLVVRGKKIQALWLISAFLVLHYFIACWQMWWYGGSFGLRPYIDFYALFAIMMVMTLEQAKRWLKTVLLFFVLLCAGLNLVQTYQYTHNILPPAEMDFKGYKDIFLETDPAYEGILAYRAHSRELRNRPLISRVKTNLKDTVYTPADWRELASFSRDLKQGEWLRLNAMVEMDCWNPAPEILYCGITDSSGSALYYEEMPLRILCENNRNAKTLNYSVEYKAAKNCRAITRIGFKQLQVKRRVKSLVLEQFGE